MLTVGEFLEETRDDFHSPTTSTFVSRIPGLRAAVNSLEESLDADSTIIAKMKKNLKSIHTAGCQLVDSELSLSSCLEKLGNGLIQAEPELCSGFLKFSIVTREMAQLQRKLMQNLQNMLLFPLDNLLKGDIRNMSDLKKPVDKSLKDYEAKACKLEKEKKALAKEVGMFRREVTPAEIADETERERRLLQLSTCDYLLKCNEIKTRKGVDLAGHFIEHYHSLCTYYSDGLKTLDYFGSYVKILSTNLVKIKQKQDEEKRRIVELRGMIRNSVQEVQIQQGPTGQQSTTPSNNTVYNHHQSVGNKSYGSFKKGYLNKKSEGKMRRIWQRRMCVVNDGYLSIHHADESAAPTRIPLLTCQLKILEDKKFFDLVSYNRTYHLNCEDEELDAWINVILNSKETALSLAFDSSTSAISQTEDLSKSILVHVHRLPGNLECGDCGGRSDTTWLSVNLGLLLCIECSGIHRTLGVNISRIQSILLDNIPPSLLIIPMCTGNGVVNGVMEETMERRPEIHDMDARTTFIHSKYIDKVYVARPEMTETEMNGILVKAIEDSDFLQVFRCWAWGMDLGRAVEPSTQNTALHLSMLTTDLRIIQFLIQHSHTLDRVNSHLQTALHYSAVYNNLDGCKLLLKSGAGKELIDKDGLSAVDIARREGAERLVAVLTSTRPATFEQIDFDWNLGVEDSTDDFSEDELAEPPDHHPLLQQQNSTPLTKSKLKRSAPTPPKSDLRLGRLVLPPLEAVQLRRVREAGGKKCRALYDCSADNTDEISFSAGDIIHVVNELTEDDNWMEGFVEEGRSGLFPVSFVEFL